MSKFLVRIIIIIIINYYYQDCISKLEDIKYLKRKPSQHIHLSLIYICIYVVTIKHKFKNTIIQQVLTFAFQVFVFSFLQDNPYTNHL